jgi:hypothetical protein
VRTPRAAWASVVAAAVAIGCGSSSRLPLQSPDAEEPPDDHLDAGAASDGPVLDADLAPDAGQPSDRPVDLTAQRDLVAAVGAEAVRPVGAEDAAACGALAQRCCPGAKCASGANCVVVLDVGGTCDPCGGHHESCCREGPGCRDAGDRCSGGFCNHDEPGCGVTGGPCCLDSRCNDADAVCVGANPGSAICKKCGHTTVGASQPCCAGNLCADGGCCVHLQSGNIGPYCVRPGDTCWELGSKCAAGGSCGPACGGANQPCCHGLGTDYCSAAGTACMATTRDGPASCLPCGKAGQLCCRQVTSQFSIPACAAGLLCTPNGTDVRCMP